MGPDLWELYEYGEADDEVAAIIRLAHFGAVPQGVRVVTQFEEIITVRLNRGDIPKISGSPETAGMSSGDTYFGADVELDAADAESLPVSAIATDQRRPADIAMTGRGIVVGVVDWGFDFNHRDFRKSDGGTRILSLWDQRGGRLTNSPPPFGYGVVHTREAINKALGEKNPYAALNYHPADADSGVGCHGTHVASIAAGTGGDERPIGIAPEADLVFVHSAPWDGLEDGKLGDSVTLLEAIDYIARAAGTRPWVVNLSMGRHGEQHDGTTLIEQGLDAAVRSAAGRAVCLSAGNYYNKRVHASGQLRPTQERELAWVINEGTPSDYNQLEVWYSWQDKFEVTVRSPDGAVGAHARLGEKVKLLSGGKEIGNLYHRAQEPNTLDHHITLYLYKSAPAGEWTVTLSGSDVIHGHYHAWIEREVSCPRCQSHFREQDADPTSTTGTICNGRRTLAVGAYNAHDPQHRMGPFSSVGPTRDGRLKPDLCAPGVSVLAARSAQREHPEDTPSLTRMSGTSMAAPHVTGAVALAFQSAVRPLRIEETHNLLLGSATRIKPQEEDPDRFGIGLLDVEAFVEAAAKADDGQRTFVPVAEKRPLPPPSPHADARAAAANAERLDAEAVDTERRKRASPLVSDPTPIDAEAVEPARRKRDIAPVSGPTLIDSETALEVAESVANSTAAVQRAVHEYAMESELAIPDTSTVARDPTVTRGADPASASDAILISLDRTASASDVFEVFAYGASRPGAALLRARFELIAAPRSRSDAVRAGDVLVRRGDLGQAYVALLASEPVALDHALGAGLIPERWAKGHYAQVIEAGPIRHGSAARYARRIAEANGYLPPNQIVLRPLGSATERASQGAESGTDDAPSGSDCRIIDDFPLDRVEIQPQHLPILVQAARDILAGGVRSVRLVGHASQDGSLTYNDLVAKRRAGQSAVVLRALIEQLQPGASTGVSWLIETRGKRQPVSREQRKNRRVEICFVATGPLPAPAGLESRLRALLNASLVLTGNTGAPFTTGALPAGLPASGKLWSYGMQFGSSGGLEASNITCLVTHHPGHRMATTVLEEVRWGDPTIRLPGSGATVLPLRAAYLLGSFHSTGGHVGARSHPVWRLESDQDLGTAVVFGYDLSDPHSPVPLKRLEDFGGDASLAAPRGPRVLVCCELVLCEARNDFEPAGVLDAGRLYPIAEIICDIDGTEIEMAVQLRRPDHSAIDHGWYAGGIHVPSLYADRNSGQGLVALATAYLTGSSTPVPTWENTFDYFERNAARAAVRAVVVDPALTGTRTDATQREAFDRLADHYALSTVTKVPRQGEFDNIHIAPQMQVALNPIPVLFSGLGPLGVSMAPACAHDCFHLHWRWGKGYTTAPNLGWGAAGPYTEAGAPMVAPNQKIEIELPAGLAAIRYQATTTRQRRGEWAVVMPHGAAYAIQLKVDPIDVLKRILGALPGPLGVIKAPILAWVAATEDRAWAWIYFFLQYWPTLSAPHFRELLMFHSLTALRRL